MDPNVPLLKVQIDGGMEAIGSFRILMGDEVERRRDFTETNALRTVNIGV